MTWQILIDFDTGGGTVDITDKVAYETIARRQSLWNALKPTVSSCQFSLAGGADCVSLANSLLAATKDIKCTIYLDGSPYFTGYIRNTFSVRVKTDLSAINIEVVDRSWMLEKTLVAKSPYSEGIQLTGKNVCVNASPTNSLLHVLFTQAGFSTSDLSFPDISVTIDSFTVMNEEKKKYKDVITALLFEVGYCYYFGVDGKAYLAQFSLSSAPVSTLTLSSGASGHILDEFQPVKSENKAECVEITGYAHKTLTNTIVFEDTTGTDPNAAYRYYRCWIPISAGGYYPTGSGTTNVFSEFKVDGYEIISVSSCSLVHSEVAGSVTTSATYYPKKAKVSFYSAAGATLGAFYITGTAIVKGDMFIKIGGQATSEKKETHDLVYVSDSTVAGTLADGLAQYYSNSKFEYTLLTDTAVSIGQIITLNESAVLGSNVVVRVIGIDDVGEGIYKITCEGVAQYAVGTIGTQGQNSGAQAQASSMMAFVQDIRSGSGLLRSNGIAGTLPTGEGPSQTDYTPLNYWDMTSGKFRIGSATKYLYFDGTSLLFQGVGLKITSADIQLNDATWKMTMTTSTIQWYNYGSSTIKYNLLANDAYLWLGQYHASGPDYAETSIQMGAAGTFILWNLYSAPYIQMIFPNAAAGYGFWLNFISGAVTGGIFYETGDKMKIGTRNGTNLLLIRNNTAYVEITSTRIEITSYLIYREAYVNVTSFYNSWVNYDTANWQQLRYTKDAFGWVTLEGFIKNGTSGQYCAIMPSGYRPAVSHWTVGICSGHYAASVQIGASDGKVWITVGPGGTNAWVAVYARYYAG